MTTQFPNLDPVQFQRQQLNSEGYRSIQQIEEERLVLNDASSRGKVPFNSKDTEDFPHKHVLTGIQELGPFSKAFFSKKNLEWLHSNIRYTVYNTSIDKTVISKQRDMDVLETMRRIYLQNSNNPESKEGIRVELLRLNDLVIKDIVPRIITEIIQNKSYLRDIEKVRVPNQLPMNTSVIGTKLYERGPADVLGLNV
jgi:hypothetical protein